MSYQDPATFSMIASRERRHKERVPRLANLSILPIAALFGGNASGKTNLFLALHLAKLLVVRGVQPNAPIGVDNFRLGPPDLPVRIEIELLADETLYAFSFSATQHAILEEKLVTISGKSEKTLYHRLNGQPNFHPSLKDDQWLHFAFKGTRDNQLFLPNSVSQKTNPFKSVFNWFKDSLELLAPDSRFERFDLFLDQGNPLSKSMAKTLSDLGTGITRLGGVRWLA